MDRVLRMGVGRFLVLWEAALRRRAERQMLSIEASAFADMDEAERKRIVDGLVEAMESREAREARWESGWDEMRNLSGKLRLGASLSE